MIKNVKQKRKEVQYHFCCRLGSPEADPKTGLRYKFIGDPYMWKQWGWSRTGQMEMSISDTGHSKPQPMLPGAQEWILPIRVAHRRSEWPGVYSSTSLSHWAWAVPGGTVLARGSFLQPRQTPKEVLGRQTANTQRQLRPTWSLQEKSKQFISRPPQAPETKPTSFDIISIYQLKKGF